MKTPIRIMKGLLLLMAIPLVIFMFFPKIATDVFNQKWAGWLWLFFFSVGVFALYLGLDLLNRVNIYREFHKTSVEEKETFWKDRFFSLRLGFLRNAILAILLLSMLLFLVLFYLFIIPKAPSGDWPILLIKTTSISIVLGATSILNAVLFIGNGKKVILGVSISVKTPTRKAPTWVNGVFQIKPTFMDAEVDLKEDFDGISELDNPPPPWFMWLFYSTVIFAAIYLVRFTWLHYGPSQTEEYNSKLAKLKTETAAFLAKQADNVDENTVTVEKDQGKIAEAKLVFVAKCATCHGQSGEGNSGPNLTDDYWIHGNSAKDIFKTIKYGYPDKGMVPWQEHLSPPKIKAMTTFILSLRGSKVSNPKAPQGEKMEPREKL